MVGPSDHVFGGVLTDVKLSMVASYLRGFTTALKDKPYFSHWYVDAFAGTGERTIKLEGKGATLFEGPTEDTIDRRKGSARIALDTRPAFDKLVFIERKKRHFQALQALKAEYVASGAYRDDQIQVIRGDANKILQEAAGRPGWRKIRAVLFLDPYGMGVEWPTLEALGRTGSIDLWYLVSLAGLYRQATNRSSNLDEKKRAALTRMLGTADWETAWYEKERTLFGEFDDLASRTADLGRIEAFVQKRLEDAFPTVLPARRLYNGRNLPMFSLYFAMSNTSPAARKVAVPIANYILKAGN
jgi:three-Cys-motif partner protein